MYKKAIYSAGLSSLDENSFFTDGYHLEVGDIFCDSVGVKGLFEVINSSKDSSSVSLYISKDFGVKRKEQFIEYLIKNTYEELEIYEGYFSIGQYPFVKHKKYSSTNTN